MKVSCFVFVFGHLTQTISPTNILADPSHISHPAQPAHPHDIGCLSTQTTHKIS